VLAKMRILSPSREQLVDFADELSKGGHEKSARQVRGFMLQIDLSKAAAGSGPTRKRIEEAVKFLQEAPPQPSDIMLAYTTGRLAEVGDDRAFAAKTYEAMIKVFAASDNPRLAEFATTLQGAVRRLSLMGQEMKLEGTTLDGEPFDWSKYRGKVVVVEFWASTYPSCLAEIGDLKKYYDTYHAKGLEIVGISLDGKLADLRKFIKDNAIPWTIVASEGKPNPSVLYYSIMSLPTTIIVNRDGKVSAISPRGEAIGKELEKLLGPAEKIAGPTEKSAEKKTEPAAVAPKAKK
jgi:peroxiredoxin